MQPVLLNSYKLPLRWSAELTYLENSVCVGTDYQSPMKPVMLLLVWIPEFVYIRSEKFR